MSSIRKEILVAILVLATLTVVFGNHTLRRKIAVTPTGTWRREVSDDRYNGGNSYGECSVSDSSFDLQYEIGGDFHTPYVVLGFRPEGDEIFDFGWVEQVKIKITGSHEQQVLFQMRNYEPQYTISHDTVSRKYNEALICVTPEPQEIVLEMADFNVPSWWHQAFQPKGASSRVDISRFEWFEFATRERNGTGSLRIESITFEGHWIATASLYQFLMWIWLAAALLGLLSRVRSLRAELVRKRQIQEQLKEMNSLLEIKSEEYSEMARRDSLTGLMNRYGVHEAIDELGCQSESTGKHSIILFDVDHFKRINDTHGHLYGDRVLVDIAEIAQKYLREEDLIARWGGDEFLIVFPETDKSYAATVAAKLCKRFTLSHLNYTCSFGVAESNDYCEFVATYNLADNALYRSKADGRNCVHSSQVDEPATETTTH